jgi:hypothetical protein
MLGLRDYNNVFLMGELNCYRISLVDENFKGL